ncbi:MAG: hypothetical protein JWO21_550, partial [Solirubrobacterales bacterium]|nr:hypothetical protein [Solirubrobacterales bacterium]
KIRYAAASNYSAPRLREALAVGEAEEMTRYVALQTHYNLMERARYEGELQAVCEEEQLPCLPYFALARGFLTGKYRPDGPEVDSPRAAGVIESYLNERGFRVLEAVEQVASGQQTTMPAVALAWLLAQPTVVAPIASATSREQLAEQLPAAELQLTAEQLELLNAASAQRAANSSS